MRNSTNFSRQRAWKVTSPWANPSFTGGFLPEQRQITKDGFTAAYRIGNLALGRSLGDRIGAFLELYGLAPAGAEGDDDAAYLDGGFTLAFGTDAQLDARAGAGLTDAAADWFFGIGFARRF